MVLGFLTYILSRQPRCAWEKLGIQSQKVEMLVWVKHAGC